MNIAEATRSRLVGAIGTMTPTDFSKDPGKHFIRNRKLPFQALLLLKISSAKGSLPEEIRHFHVSKGVSPEDAPSKSSYIQQCGKLSEDAFPTLLHKFNDACSPPALFQGHQLIACDGSGFAFHSDRDWDAYVRGENEYFDFLRHGESGEIPLTVRIVRVKIKEGVYEYLATNLGRAEFPLLALKEIYRLRWGIETSFRDLKHTLGAEKFRSRQREFVIQEIWSRMILYNFCMEIVNQAVLKKQGCKYVYRINIAQALRTCHEFLRACRHVRKSMDVIGWILKAEPCPVREGRNFPRKKKHQGAQSFNYR